MKIDRKLNLVIPIEREDGTVYVHSMPLGAEVFDKYYLVIAKAFAAIYKEGLSFIAGPRVAARTIETVAKDLGVWDGPEGVEIGLLGEIRRLSNMLVLDKDGWRSMPLDTAVKQGLLDAEEQAEVLNFTCFFIVSSAMHKLSERTANLQMFARVWSVQITSSTITDFKATLLISTVAETTGAKAIPLSIAS